VAEKIQEHYRRTTNNNNDGRRRHHWRMDIPGMKMLTAVLSKSGFL
jgi:hypothetical protein